MRDEYIFQHYVPRMHLRKFAATDSTSRVCATDSTSRVWVFDKPNERQFLSGFDNIAGEDFFYDPADFEDPEIESLLQSVEQKSGGPYKKLLNEGSLLSLTRKERMRMGLFLAVQFNRTRERRNALVDSGGQTKEALKEKGIAEFIPDEEFEQLGTEEFARTLQNDTLKENSAKTGEIFLKKNRTLLVNRTGTPFWTSDHPLCLHNQRDFGPFRGSLDIENQGIEIYFPLSPEYMLVLLDSEDFEGVYSKMPVLDERIVKNTNSLQVSQSNRQIFSAENDFKLAEEMIEGIPELKDPDNAQRFVEGYVCTPPNRLCRHPLTGTSDSAC